MGRPRHLSKAPITEAVIDLRVNLPADFDVKVFASVGGEIGNKYGPPQNINLFTRERSTNPALDTGHLASRCRSERGTRHSTPPLAADGLLV